MSSPMNVTAGILLETDVNKECTMATRTAKTTKTDHRHIVRNERILSGEPIINGTRTPVRAIVETWRMGIIAEEIPHHMPHLSMAQVFDALSYFSDHPDEIMEYIERNRVRDEELSIPEETPTA